MKRLLLTKCYLMLKITITKNNSKNENQLEKAKTKYKKKVENSYLRAIDLRVLYFLKSTIKTFFVLKFEAKN